MTIDLSNPIVIGVSITVISAAILGIIHYVKTLVQLNFTDKKLSNVLSEMNMLHQNYKEEISNIKKRHNKEIDDAMAGLDRLEKKMDKFLEHNKPLHGFNVLSEKRYNLLGR